MAAPTHESDVFRGHKLKATIRAITSRRVEDSIYPLKPLSKLSFVQAWIEDVAHQDALSPDEPLEIANCCLDCPQNLTVYEKTVSNIPMQSQTAAAGSTYGCTYHGCMLRFETPVLLRKHKREGHRKDNTLNHSQDLSLTERVASGVTSSQDEPHRCDRLNPSTGKACNTIFSRSYDLERHQITIHNLNTKWIRCSFCTEEKLFSRADALTRHIRVCHPNMSMEIDKPTKLLNHEGKGTLPSLSTGRDPNSLPGNPSASAQRKPIACHSCQKRMVSRDP